MAKCGNWGSAVICQVGSEPPAILLRVCEGCLFPRYWNCQGQDSMKEPLGLVTFGYALDQGCDGRFWCQELLLNTRSVQSNFSGSGGEEVERTGGGKKTSGGIFLRIRGSDILAPLGSFPGADNKVLKLARTGEPAFVFWVQDNRSSGPQAAFHCSRYACLSIDFCFLNNIFIEI